MGLTKTDAFTKSQNQVSAICKALGHPARIAIIEHLISTNSCITGDLVEVLPLSQATVSQHLRELKNAGIINVFESFESSELALADTVLSLI